MSAKDKQDCYSYVTDDGVCFVKFGRQATHLIAGTVTRYIDTCNQLTTLSTIHLDLSETDYLDSTFMGMIILLHQRYCEDGDVSMNILKPTEKAFHHLETTGLNEILTVLREFELPTDEEYRSISISKLSGLEKEELMLDAHEKLSELNDVNRIQFALLNKTLRADIERKRNKNKL